MMLTVDRSHIQMVRQVVARIAHGDNVCEEEEDVAWAVFNVLMQRAVTAGLPKADVVCAVLRPAWKSAQCPDSSCKAARAKDVVERPPQTEYDLGA